MTSKRRPTLVTWLAVGVLILSAFNWARFLLSLSLPELPLSVPAWYLPGVGLVWGASGLADAIGLMTRRPWAPKLTRWGGLVYVLWFSADRIWLARSDFAAQTRPFELAASLVVLGCVWWVLQRPASRAYFGERPS